MEEGVRSSEGLVKKKNSSGCLVIKKKVDGSRKVIESNKERKRPRLVLSDSGSSDESEPRQRKVVTKTGSFQNGSVGQNGETDSERKRRLDVFEFDEYENMNDYEHHRFKRTSRKWNESEFDSGSSRSLMIEKRKKSYFDSGSNSSSGGRKRAPNYTFKDSLEVDDDEAHLPISSFRHKVRVPSDEPIRLQGKNGVLKVMVNNKKKMDVPHKFGDRQMEVGDRKGSKSENAIRKKNVSIGPSFYSESKSSEKPISVVRTDKSGLKTRKPVSKSVKGGNSETEDSDTSLRQGPTSGQVSKGVRKSEEKAPSAERITPVRAEKSEIKVRRPLSKSVKGGDSETEDSDSSLRRGPASGKALKGVRKSGDKAPSAERITPIRAGKSEVKVRRSLSKRVKGGDSETDDSDSLLRREPRSGQAHGSSKRVRRSEEKAPSAEKVTPGRGKEVKIKRGSGTEKQLLREKIRDMLISAGWTIDYRPRRNRDYLDSVYISPTGTAYWSIIKAYDALQKQQDEDDAEIKPSGDSSLFTPLPDELLSKLTRQTRKKIEKEMKLKRRNARTKRGKERREESAEDTGKSQKGRSDETSNVSGDDSSSDLSPKRERSGKQSTATNSHLMQGRKSRKIGRCTLLVRSSDKRVNSQSDGYVPYSGKRTVLSWLIDSGVVHLSERVQYMNRQKTRTLLEGWINRDGIHCGCCSKILTVPKFEIHAGNKPRHPFQHIYLESGISLLQCQVDAWNKQESKRSGFHTVGTDGDDPDDDTCGLCGDGGDLICCDGCPSTFHQSCLDIQMLPPGDWHCPNCICKFCGIAGEVSADGDHPTVSALLTCSLCEKKYHASCSQEVEPADVNRASTSFCGIKCRELFDSLQKLLGIKHELEAGLSWSLIHRTDIDADASHRGFPQRVECNSKLAVALSVMDECFLTIVDRRSGINLIHNVLYNCGSNFSRLNYSSFYTAILERGDEIVAAASIRIRGTQLAEMPFIGTRHIYRRQGMCRRLLSAIELVLCSLKVEKLFIPAIAEHMNTWTTVFGFNPLEESHKQELRSMNMLVFPGTDMLQKPLVEQKTTEENITANSDTKSVLIKEDLCLAPDLAKKSDADSSADHDIDIGDNVIIQNSDDVDEKAAAVDSSMDALAVPPHDNAVLNSLADVSCEPKIEVVSEENVSLHSQQVEKSTDSPGDSIKFPPSSNLHHDLINMENPALDPSVQIKSSEEGIVGYVDEANIEAAVAEPVLDSSGGISTMDTAEGINGDKKPLSVCTVDETDEGIVGDVHGANIKASVGEQVLDSVEGISTMDTAEGINGDKKPLSLSTVDDTDETLTESNSDLSPRISDCTEYKLHATSESEAKVDEPVEGNIESFVDGIKDDNHDAEVKVLHSLGEISAMKEKNEIPDPVSMACSNGNDECSVQLASDLNQPDALDLPNKMIVASLVSSAEVASNAEVVMVEGGNIQSSAASNSGDAPLLDSLDDSYTQKIPEEVNDKLHHVPLSNLCAKDESIKQCNSNWNNQSICEVESEVPVASEVSCEADVAPVKNDIRTSAVGGIDENVNEGKVASVEPVLDSLQEISARENDVHGDPDPASVSTLNISALSTIEVNSDWNKQNSLEVESNLHAASEVVLDGSKILSSAEDGIGEEAQEAENATEEIKASVAVPSIDEADGSFVAFEYDQNSHRNAMETELS